jgi:transposase
MKKYSKYVGLDVHAETIAIAVADHGRKGDLRSLGTIPNDASALRRALGRIGKPEGLLVCYEAGPCGYGIYWLLESMGIECTVVAPTLIPVRTGDRVKTDRRDALKLARLLRSGELVAAWVPSKEDEALRNLVRTRTAAKRDERRAKNRLTKFLLRMGKRPSKKMKSFGHAYRGWLQSVAETFELESNRRTFEEYYAEWTHQHVRVERIEELIDAAVEKLSPMQREVFQALCSLRGVAKVVAVTALAEIGSFSRFDSPRQLMSYAGIVSAEYSSGNSVNRGGITKTGNAFLRHVIIETAWHYRFCGAVAGASVRERRSACSATVVHIAEKADRRLSSRYRHLVARGKLPQKAVTAVARELLGFMWAVAVDTEQRMETTPKRHAKAA